MKNITYYITLLILVSTACEGLEENPDFSTAENFYTSPEQLLIGVNGTYDGLGYGDEEWFNHYYNRYVFESLVGYQVGWEKGPLDFQNGNVNPADGYIEAYWNLSYRFINSANTIIASADKLLEDGTTDDALVSRVKGEALFLRAFYYYNLVRYFDNIPVTDTPTLNDEEPPNNEDGWNRALTLVENDLIEATGLLPASYDGTDIGRATEWAAHTLLMKAYLQHEKWDEALTTADHIVTNSGLSLFSDFSNNFDLANENSGERIFEAQVSSTAAASETNNHNAHFVPEDLPTDQGGVGWYWLYGTKDFRMKYDDADTRIPGTFLESYPTNRLGRKTDGSWPTVTWSPTAEFTLTSGLVDNNLEPDADPNTLIFGRPHSNKLFESGPNESWEDEEKNVVYLRYADVLLGHSEAANESGSGDPFIGINEVRTRAGLPPLAGLSQAALRDAIIEERVLEFAFEQEVYPELKRKSTFGGNPDYLGQYIQDFIDTYGVERELSARDYVLPIPLNELLSNPNVTQNDVWK